jgi:hypothetical protein
MDCLSWVRNPTEFILKVRMICSYLSKPNNGLIVPLEK